jgi:ATP-dependent DNA helicase RecQ
MQPQTNRETETDIAERLLRDVFGFDEYRGTQKDVIAATLAGRDSIVLMPTGGGKSLCYQIPALVRDGVGLVISPLIALMHDQVRALQELGISAAFLNSSQTSAQQQAVIDELLSGQLKLLYIAPERLVRSATQALLRGLPVSVIAIDEAHCVSQWGHDFRRDYLMLNQLAALFPGTPRMALTATATALMREDIAQRLELNTPEFFVSGFDRPNIRYVVQTKTDARRQLLAFLGNHRDEAGIIYCLARRKTESIAEWLQTQGFDALPYHAGLSAETRLEHQRRFVNDEAVIIVATIAFGMGIDKPDVRFVAHLDLPKSIESYYQETGRAGRDGEPAEAWMIYGLQDVVRLRQMLDSSDADEQFKRHEAQKLDALLGWCEITQCRRAPLLRYFGDEQAAACGNCDNCSAPPSTWDGTQAARQLLSAVHRTGQRFGAAHIVDVLLGRTTEKVTANDHDQLSVFGIGREIDAQTWRSIVRQLVVLDYLKADPARFGGLALTNKCRPLLRGEITLQLRGETKAPALRRKPARKNGAVSDADSSLWDALRECRKELAQEHDVPPYVIFHDATLMQMMEYRPANLEAMLGISGVGPNKLDRYGAAFLEVIRNAKPAA